ncbi:helix-turn-helix transcriptional regulator [Pseudoalteromonas denitrificans]|uniref:DNA-binding response regulator, NarL/FixJ family, contains REC and HTH domains n=1 Tax=Pseudoalteromonas denitrificans DSM 6059 TaxID=1123010 RepID=A0A1I1UH55_9GAMM|nr:LuxR C-terminal-related transcriptional regulator [Pseudoalteromonas denitrificans]SFD70202.1 DNA-binding response regulator, NarL/FixJ family, contains REC and HTH domains [Pseudoalteromonas denitrificans DSM 6059]
MDSKTSKKNKAFILTCNLTLSEHVHQVAKNDFIGLVNTCAFETSVNEELPENTKVSAYDIYFIDLFNSDWGHRVPFEFLQLAENSRVVLFNVQNTLLCEKYLLLAGIEGVFYFLDRPDIILKGLNQLQKKERWFKRSSMNHALAHLLKLNKNSVTSSANMDEKTLFPTLTKRENTIINLVKRGAQNQEIADLLNISTNTVKTHVYSIFRKTKSRNRVELITWSLQFATATHLENTIN